MLPQSYHEVLYSEVADALHNLQNHVANYPNTAVTPQTQEMDHSSLECVSTPIDLDSLTRTTGKEHYLG